MTNLKPTKDTYNQLQKAYNHFNKKLFKGALNDCVITLHRKRGAYGYFWAETWQERSNGKNKTDEIALNPEHFRFRTVEEILSTLVHEMAHLEQHHYGKPSRSGYHNKEWANMMEAVGLIPSITGQEGGRKTGQSCSHYIETNGRFEIVCAELIKAGFALNWQAVTKEGNINRAKRKVKYTCPVCEANVWGKPEMNIECGDCEEQMKEN